MHDAMAVTGDPVQERAYAVASELFLHPPKVQEKSRLLLSTLAFFIIASLISGGSNSLPELGILIGVLVLHELGHAAAMLVFGYRDVRIFFIPFFGAAAQGTKRGVARWKEGVVLLMGPLPGLVAGVALLLAGVDGLARTAAMQLVAINALNLLPVAPLDGGQLFSLLLFSRHRHLEIGFLTVAAFTMLVGGILVKAWVLGVLGALMLFGIPLRKTILAAGSKLRTAQLPDDPSAVDAMQRRTLFDAVWAISPPQWRARPRSIASGMEQVLESATRKPPSVAASAGLLVGWAAGIALAVAGGYAWIVGAPEEWQVYHSANGTFSIELPAKADEPAGAMLVTARRGPKRQYAVSWTDNPPGEMRTDAEWADVLRRTVAGGGKIERELDLGTGVTMVVRTDEDSVAYVHARRRGMRAYLVFAVAPEEEPASERVIRSFKLD